MKPALCLDLDDIIYPLMDWLVPYYNDNHEASFTIEDYWTFQFDDIWKKNNVETVKILDEFFAHATDKYKDMLPLTGVDIAIPALANHFRLFIVTSRPDEFHLRTTTWLEHHFPDTFEGLYLCNSYMRDGRETVRTKVSVVEELDAIGLVDDSASHIREVAEAGRVGILFGDYAWSRNHELPHNALKAANWTEVVDLLMKEIA